MQVLLAISVVLSVISAEAQLKYERGVDWNLPQSVLKRFESEKLLKTYDLCDKVNPFYLRGDFDGDGAPDYAVLVTNRATNHVGVAIARSGAKRIEVLGAGGTKLRVGASQGKESSYLLDDFDWMDAWEVQRKHRLEPSDLDKPITQMTGEGIEVAKKESASALIYWDGQQYRWLQLGD